MTGYAKLAVAAATTFAVSLVNAAPALATNFNVANTADLVAALNPSTGAQDSDTVTFTQDITLTQDLPAVQRNVTIVGQDHALSGNNLFRGFFVGKWTAGTSTQVAVSVSIQDLTITNARARGGAGGGRAGGGAGLGGALFVANLASLALDDVQLTSNNATGGAGGNDFIFGGAGGGMGGIGGEGSNSGGGGLGSGASGALLAAAGSPGIALGAASGGNGSEGQLGGTGGGGGGAGNNGGGGGGVGGSASPGGDVGGAGGFGGGGGSSVGAGGFGGGGGGGGSGGGAGGFGGGGGGAQFGSGGSGGFGAGNGGSSNALGGAGAGMGGAIFVQQGGSLTIAGPVTLNGNTVNPGTGGNGGAQAFGGGIFMQGNDAGNGGAGSLAFSPANAETQTVSDPIADQTGSGGSGGNAGNWRLTKTGDGTLTLTGANTYSGGTTVSAGILQGNTTSLQGNITDNAQLIFDQASNGTYGGIVSGTGSLTKAGNGTLTLTGANTYIGGTTVSAGTLQGATTSLQGNITDNAQLTFDQATNGTYGEIVSGTGSLTKAGNATVTLTGPNTYTGGTTVNAGTLRGNTTSLHGNIVDNAALEFSQATNGTYSGIASGTGTLTKTGAGEVTLSGANTYSGGTTVSAGTLRGNTTSLQGNIVDNAALEFSQATNGTYGGIVSGTGMFTKAGNGTVTLTGASTYTGGTTVSAGTLRGDTTSLQGNITNNAQLEFDQGADGTYGDVISGVGSLSKLGNGTLTLSDTNTYSGGTAVNAGTLLVTGSIAGSQVDVDVGATLAGNGAVGDITANGTVAPGTSIGNLTVGGTAAFVSGSDLEVELASGGVADRLSSTGTVNLGNADLDVSLLGPYNHSAGTVYEIVQSSSSIVGTFSGPSTFEVDGHRFQISYADPTKVTLTAVRANATVAGNASGPVMLGGQVSDTATLSGGVQPGGQMTFRLYGPDDANCSGPPVFTDTKAVSGNGSYSSASFTPSQPGTYRWTASYEGDEDNDATATGCGDASQSVTVSAEPQPQSEPAPSLKVTGVDRKAGTATLTVEVNVPGALRIEETKKIKGFGPVTLDSAGTAELEVKLRNRAANRLRRFGRVTVNPRILFNPTGNAAAMSIRHRFDLRQD